MIPTPSKISSLRINVASIAIFSLAASPLVAADYSWTGLVDTNWADSGNWNPTAVPTSGDNAFVDNGTAVISGGTMSTAILVVGKDADGTINLNGGVLNTTNAYLSNNGAGTGRAVVDGGVWNASTISVGSTGSLLISSGTVNISGGIGVSANSSLTLNGGALNIVYGLYTNEQAVQVTVNGGEFTAGELRVNKNNVFTMTGGTASVSDARIGDAEDGGMNFSGGSWTSDVVRIGPHGAGVLNVSGGTFAGDLINVGDAVYEGPGYGILNVSGSGAVNANDMVIGAGSQNSGTLNLAGGGSVVVSGQITVASVTGSIGVLNVGTGGTVGTLSAARVFGGSGTATVNFNHTGSTTFGASLEGSLTVNKLGVGTTTLSGSSSVGSTIVRAGELITTGAYASSQIVIAEQSGDSASLSVEGGSLTSTAASLMVGNSGAGTLKVKSGAATAADVYLGYNAGSSGTLAVSGGTMSTAILVVGRDGNGSINLTGGALSSTNVYLSNGAGTGSAVVDGGVWNASTISVGSTGSLLISSGTVNISGGIGVSANSSLTLNGGALNIVYGLYTNEQAVQVTVNGGEFTAGELRINKNNVFTMTGGTASVSDARIGDAEDGGMNFSGGSWTSDVVRIGPHGAGVLNVSGGTFAGDLINVGDAVYEGPGYGILNVSGSGVVNANDMVIGAGGQNSGTLNLSGGGSVVVDSGAGQLTVASVAGGIGVLNVGTGGAAGTLSAARVFGGPGMATVNFNHTGTTTFGTSLEGSLTVNKLGAGTTILSGTNFYFGGTTIAGGALVKSSDSALGTGAVVVSAGTLLVNGGVNGTNNSVVLSGGGFDRVLTAGADLKNAVDATSNFSGGNPDTTAHILQGTLTTDATLQTHFENTSVALNDFARRSDVYFLHGTGTDVFVLQLSMTSIDINSSLGWLDTNTNTWVNAALGNIGGGTPTFVMGAYNPETDFHLGYYGIDTATGSVWAVTNREGYYAIVVPEPSTYALIALALLGLPVVRFFRTSRLRQGWEIEDRGDLRF